MPRILRRVCLRLTIRGERVEELAPRPFLFASALTIKTLATGIDPSGRTIAQPPPDQHESKQYFIITGDTSSCMLWIA
jgi:hypothetical protein